MRKIQLLLVALFAFVGNAFAALPDVGTVGYLYNKGTGKFINAQATVSETGVLFNIADKQACGDSFGSDDGSVQESGYTYIRFKLDGTGNYMRMTKDAVSCAGSGYHKWAVMETENGWVIRCIYSNTQSNGALNPFAQQGYYLTDEGGALVLAESPAEASFWQLFTQEEYDAAVAEYLQQQEEAEAEATKELLKDIVPGDDVTRIIKNPGFDDQTTTGWSLQGGAIKGQSINPMVREVNAAFEISQIIRGVTPGWYKLQVQAFGREEANAAVWEKVLAGTSVASGVYVYANETAVPAKVITDDLSATELATDQSALTEANGNTVYIPNGSNSIAQAFTNGLYENVVFVKVGEDGVLKIGVKKPQEANASYVGVDNFRLTYCGDDFPQTVENGKYYLYNIASQKFFGGGNKYGTQASLLAHAGYVTLTRNAAGYTIKTQAAGTNCYFGVDGYVDQAAKPVYVTPYGKAFKIWAADASYGYDGTSTVITKTAEGDNALWALLTEEEMQAQLATATAEAPVDATWKILHAGFDRSTMGSQSAWIVSADCTNKNLGGGAQTNFCAESYHSLFTISQQLENMPAGLYALKGQAFYRQDGSDNENLPEFFITDNSNNNTAAATFPLKTTSENSMTDASNSFAAGKFAIEPIYLQVTGEGGAITVGVRNPANANLWCIWDNIELIYYGKDASEGAVAALAKKAAYLEALAAAQALAADEDPISAKALADLTDAINTYAEDKVLVDDATAESIEEAIAALKAATDAAILSKQAAAALAGILTVLESTNVYTQTAYEAYQAYFDELAAKFEAGTLTETVVNPCATQGWHSANNYDDYLLSAWTIGGAQCKDFDTALYINTWSNEGAGDGTNFTVPFFEYWTGDANSLGANTLEATVTDLAAGTYNVTAWVRVRAKNNTAAADATGITLSVNDGDAVDVTEGATTGQFNLAEYTATGVVGEDGILKITFNVTAENNISWLSFKNVVYVKEDIPTAVGTVPVNAGKTSGKFMQDGKIVIMRDGKKYNVAGVELK